MTGKDTEVKYMPRTTAAEKDRIVEKLDEYRAEIANLSKLVGDFRVEAAKSQGATDAKMEQLMSAVKALDGLASRVSVLETRCAVVEAKHTEADKQTREWRDESISDRAKIKGDIEALEKVTGDLDKKLAFYAGMFAVLSVVVQLVLKFVFNV